MPLFNSQDILVVGAGVLGLCTAAELVRRGHAVTVVDPGGLNASGVAAGMIAPAMESAVDDLSPEHAALLRRARDAWADFAAATSVRLDRDLAEWRGGNVEVLAGRLAALGFEHAYDRMAGRLTTNEDWKIEPAQALAALTQGVRRLEGRATSLSWSDGRWRVKTTAGLVEADQVVLATGVGTAPGGLPETVARLLGLIAPIRGQIGLVSERLLDHVVRGPGAYVAPMGQGCVIGATMEAGERSLTPDPERCAQMLEAAWRVLGQTPRALEIEWRAGVRGATPDGLPMAGAVEDRLHLAVGPRRNGWLLGPLVAGVVADEVEGRSSKEPTLVPRRFI
ncbi:NAD(P)/FAD-dependent oxidoreductase [Brevundimonas sp. NPDC046655]|uniref:NAD(P)/FAD-dependent oxidoreductase n=1 Tax=unclassified Brevundimonas TaxID=2622653 RepID=UPI00384EDD3C